MNPEDNFLDFLRRTRENLATIDKWRADDPATLFHEVTNLINSLLGLIVMPEELIPNEVRQLAVGPHGIPAWEVHFEVVTRPGRPPAQLRPLLTGLRNSIAHSSWVFKPDGPNIGGVTFENRTRDAKTVLWTAEFELEDLHGFLAHLTTEIEDAYGRRRRRLNANVREMTGSDPDTAAGDAR